MKQISSEDKTINSLCQNNFFKRFGLIQVVSKFAQCSSVLQIDMSEFKLRTEKLASLDRLWMYDAYDCNYAYDYAEEIMRYIHLLLDFDILYQEVRIILRLL